MPKEVRPSAERVQHEVIDERVFGVVVVQAHPAEAPGQIERRGPFGPRHEGNCESIEVLQPGVVRGKNTLGSRVHEPLREGGIKADAEFTGERVFSAQQFSLRVKPLGRLVRVDEVLSGGGEDAVRVIRRIDAHGLGEFADIEANGSLPTEQRTGVAQPEVKAVWHSPCPEVDIRSGEAQLARERGGMPACAGEVHGPEDRGAEVAGGQTVFAHRRKSDGRGIGLVQREEVVLRLEVAAQVCFRFFASRTPQGRTSDHHIDCRAEADGHLQHAAKFRYSATVSAFPSRICS